MSLEGRKNKQLQYLAFALFISVKLAQVFWLSYLTQCSAPDVAAGYLAIMGGDTPSYLSSFDHLYTEGSYYFFNGTDKIYASRMPYYGAIYYLLLHVFAPTTCYTIQILIQVFFEILASWLLCLYMYRMLKTEYGFYLTLFFLTITLQWTHLAIYLLPESLGISFLIISIYCYDQYKKTNALKWIFRTGIVLMILVGLKNYWGILFPVLGLDLLWHLYKEKITLKKAIQSVTLFSVTFVLLTTMWTYRNYQVTGHAYPLVQPYSGYKTYSNPINISYRNLIATWGESDEGWNKATMGSFFFDRYETNYKLTDLPTTSYCNQDSLLLLRSIVSNMHSYSKAEQETIAKRIDRFTQSFLDEDPMIWISSRLSLVKKFVIHSGSYYLPISSGFDCYHPSQMIVKLLESLLYYWYLIFGFLGLFLLTKRERNYIWLFVPIFLIFLFAGVMRLVEWRYFLYSYISFLCGTVYLLEYLRLRFWSKEK